MYEPTNPSLWQGRKDSLPLERFFQRVRVVDLNEESLKSIKPATLFLGFCSDEGIARNEGRLGAKLGPNNLRQQLAKLACHSSSQFVDIGNIVCEKDLELAQEEFADLISQCHELGHKTIAFGGGHEIAFGHFRGLATHYSKLGIINFDSHFDLRQSPTRQSTSGTPFLQIADYCTSQQLPFHYCCLGIQKLANTQSLFATARQLKVSYLTREEMNQNSLSWQNDFLDQFIAGQDHLYLSLCLDVFAECFAPGVSAPQSLGLTPWQTLPLLKYILQTGKVVSLDVAELSPTLDVGQKTARLAASLLAELLDHF